MNSHINRIYLITIFNILSNKKRKHRRIQVFQGTKCLDFHNHVILALLLGCFSLIVLLTCSEPLSPQPEVDASANSTDSIAVCLSFDSSQTYEEMGWVTATPIQEDYPGSVNKMVDDTHENYDRVPLA